MDINEPTEQPNQLTKDELDKRIDQEPWPTPLTAGKDDIIEQPNELRIDEQTREEINREYIEKYESDNKPAEGRGMASAYRPERSSETEKAFNYLEKLLLKEDADTHHRIAAARTILDFAHL